MPIRDNVLLLAAGAVAAACIMPTTARIQLGNNGNIMWDNNCNFTENNCRSMKAIPQVCCDVCARDSTCTDWIWNKYNGGTCWLQNGAQFDKSVKSATNCGYTDSGNVKKVQAQAQVPVGAQVQPKVQAPAQVPAVVQVPARSQVPARAQVPAPARAQVSAPARAQVPAPAGAQAPTRAQSVRITSPSMSPSPSGSSSPSGSLSPSGSPSPQVQPLLNSGLSAAEMGEMLTRLNAFRAQNGLNALTVDNRLVASSALHSKDQAAQCRMTHAGSDGSILSKRIEAQGYKYVIVTENVAAGQMTVEEVLTGWKNSPRHRANLLSEEVKNVGFAKAVNTGCSSYDTYWTQDFGLLE